MSRLPNAIESTALEFLYLHSRFDRSPPCFHPACRFHLPISVSPAAISPSGCIPPLPLNAALSITQASNACLLSLILAHNTPLIMPPPASPQPSAFLNTVLNPHSHTTTPTRPVRAFDLSQRVAQPPTFLATQRSLQARNKEYNVFGRKEESYEIRQRREEASTILESTEMLIWWSAARNEVRRLLPQSCYPDLESTMLTEMEIEYTTNPPSLPKHRPWYRRVRQRHSLARGMGGPG